MAGLLAVLSLAIIGVLVWRERPAPTIPNMANAGAAVPGTAGGNAGGPIPAGPAPDISQMTPRERFDRLFNRIMTAAERGDSAEVLRFTPMALGAYAQLDVIDADARYHAAVLQMQVGNTAAARALADTILAEVPGHLFGYVVRGTAAELMGDSATLAQARREFVAHYDAEIQANRVEYLEHRPVLEQFRQAAE